MKTKKIGGANIEKMKSGNLHVRIEISPDPKTGKRRWKSITAPTYDELYEIAAPYLVEKQQVDESITVKQALEKYIETCRLAGHSPSTIAGYKKMLKRGFTLIENKKVDKITPGDVQDQINESASTSSVKTVKNRYSLLHSALAVYAPRLNLSRIKLPTDKNKAPNNFDVPIQQDDDIVKLLQYTKDKPNMHIAILLASQLGLRRSEICALNWQDVNWQEKYIDISKAMVVDENDLVTVKATKSGKGTRILPMSDALCFLLKPYAQEQGRMVNLDPDSITDQYRRIKRRLGISGRFHDLRAYHCSLMVELNVNSAYIMKDMGHSTDNLYRKVYTHLRKNKQSDIYDALNNHATELFNLKDAQSDDTSCEQDCEHSTRKAL